MKELNVEKDTVFIMVPTIYPIMSSSRNHDAFDEVTFEDSMEEFNYSMQRILNHNYIWEEFMNDLKFNSTRNLNIPSHPLTKSETYTWKKKPYEVLRFVCAFTLSGIQKAEEEGQSLPLDIKIPTDIEKFKCKMEHSASFMTLHGLVNDLPAVMNTIMIRNFSGTVVFKKKADSMYAEELVTIKEESNNGIAI